MNIAGHSITGDWVDSSSVGDYHFGPQQLKNTTSSGV